MARLLRTGLALAAILMVAGAPLAQELKLPKTEEEKKKLSGREIKLLRRQMKAREDEATAAYKNAETAFLVGEYDKAIEEYLSVSREYSETSYRMRSVLRVGDVYYRQKKYERAVSYYQRALRVPSELWWPEESKEDYARADYMIGVCFFDQKALNQAFAHFRRFVQKYPDSRFVDRAYDFIGRGNMEMKRYGQAIEAFRMVGTARLTKETRRTVSPGEELYVRVDDADVGLATKGARLPVRVTTTGGDEEQLLLEPLGLGSPIFLGTIKTRLGAPRLTEALEATFSREARAGIEKRLADAETMQQEAEKIEAELAELPEPTEPAEGAAEEETKRAQELQAKRQQLTDQRKKLQAAGENLRKQAYSALDSAYAAVEKLLTEWNIEQAEPEQPETPEAAGGGDAKADPADASGGENDEQAQKADTLSDVFTPQQITEVRDVVKQQPTAATTFKYREAVLEYWHNQLVREHKTLDVNGADTITVAYTDHHGVEESGAKRLDALGIASDATISCVGQDYESSVQAVILGDEVRVRVFDPDMDRTAQPDSLDIAVSAMPKRQEKEDLTDGKRPEAAGDEGEETAEQGPNSVDLFVETEEEEEAPPLVPEGAPSFALKLRETGEHTGVFTATFATLPEDPNSPVAKLALSAEKAVRVAYRDDRNPGHSGAWVVVSEVDIVLGAEGEHEVIEMQESKLDRRSELEKG
ncbi:MAG: tetratricopeptide repeat protein, partial [Planctomycetes bacterium]|nr:tetratricopeptide repeat protein [Planctomycetota bacterium]